MFKFGKIAVLVIVLTMLISACGGSDNEVPAPPVEAPPAPEVDTSGFEDAIEALADLVAELDAKVDALAAAPAVPDEEETGGGAVVLQEDRVPLVTTYKTTDEDGNPVFLSCGLAQVINDPVFILQKAMNADGSFKENAAGYPIMQKAPNFGPMDEDYVCVDSPPIRVDGGSVFRLQYAEQEDLGDNDDWRGVGGDWHQCCFVDIDDILREFYP